MRRREEPTASSRAALAKRTVPSPPTTATSVASRSKDAKRWLGEDLFKPSFCGDGAAARTGGAGGRGARELTLQSFDVSLVPLEGGLHFGHAIEVLLVVAMLGTEHLRLPVV